MGVRGHFGKPSFSVAAGSVSADEREQIALDIERKVRQQLTEEIKREVTEQLMAQFGSCAQPTPPFAVPPHLSTKESCAAPSVVPTEEVSDGMLHECYIDDDPIRLVAIGKVFDGTAVLHGKPLPAESVKVSVVECREKDARVPLPTDEVQVVSQALNSFIAWPKHLVKPLGYQVISI